MTATLTEPAVRRRPLDAGTRTVAVGVLWAGLLLVTYWWAADGIRDLGEWETGLTSLGRLTGLLGADLLLIQVLLMARLPAVERAFGQDRLVKMHRTVGFTSFNLVLAHLVLITWGYAAGDLTRTPGELWDLVTNYPAMLLATAGTACLVLTVVTSIRKARAKLRYESWHLLHLYGYLGVGLALPHQLWTGQEFLTSTAATVYWWSLWAAAAAAILVWRLGIPLWRNARHRLEVTAIVPEDDDVVSVYLTGRHLDRLPARPGQFLGWRFLNRTGWTRGNPYSLSAAPDGRSLRITVRALGDGSALRGVRPGTRVLFEGPFGRLTESVRTRHRVALIGAGVGVAPLRALAEDLEDAVLLHRFRRRPLFAAELHALTRDRGLRVVDLPGHRRSPGSWLGDGVPVDDLTALPYLVPDIAERDVYICGPAPWAESVRRAATAAGVPADRIHVEEFSW
ncbi:ferredoxin reductase family protein [Lentzea sp. NPDC051838]|uniref:ferredoxin reductase family protein n=1 Tax=Lentzea sp. NPDC051838 TaxID=3154849 RepID=UPI00342C03CF